MDQRIESIEHELSAIRRFADIERKSVELYPSSRSARFFLQAKETQVVELESELRRAKDVRRNELLELRISGARVGYGEIPLELLARISSSLETLLVATAHKVFTGEELSTKRTAEIRALLNLRMSGIGAGSTRLFFVGDLTPDMTGESVLETALKGAFGVFNAESEQLGDAVDTVGVRAAKSCKRLLASLASEGLQTNFVWRSASQIFDWSASSERAQSLKNELDALGEPNVTEESVSGEVRNLSDTGRLEIRTRDHARLRIKVPKEKYHLLQNLHLGQIVDTVVLAYEWSSLNGKRTAFHLKTVS